MGKNLYEIVSTFGATGFTPDGGLYQTFTNQTGTSIKGTIVMQAAGTDNAAAVATAGSPLAIGVIYEDSVANGSPVKVVTYGRAQVLLRNGQSVTRGNWCVLSSVTNGRMEQGTITGALLVSAYAEGIGVSLESKSSGTDVLAWIQLQFN